MVGGYGAGCAIIGPLATNLIAAYGWRATFQILGATFFAMGLIGTALLKNPPAGYKAPAGPPAVAARARAGVDMRTRGMMGTTTFAALWIAYCLGTTAGQMMISQLVPFMRSVGLAPDAAALPV